MTTNREPSITLTRDDYRTLTRLAELRRDSSTADYLSHELSRARVVSGGDEAPDTVRMGSHVSFRDLEADAVREVVLVMPNESDIAKGRISILTPVGAALLGLSVEQTISFTAPGGYDRSLMVLKITQPRDDSDDGLSSGRA